MSEESDNISRRTVLSTTGALAFTGLAGVQSVRADSNSSRESDGRRTAGSRTGDSGSVELTSENSGTKQEWVSIMKQRDIVHPAVNEDVSSSSADANLQNLTYVDHWKQTSDLAPNCPQGDNPNFSAEHLCTVYKAVDDEGAIVQDSNGQYRYIVELWQQCTKSDSSGFLCADAEINLLRSNINDKDGDVTFHGRDPAGTERVNDERISVRHYTEVGGVAFGGDEVVRFNDGLFGAIEWTPGPEGSYTVSWNGEEKQIQDIIAFVDIGSDSKLDFDDEDTGIVWNYRVETGF
ncbi:MULTISPECIES: hypothetical protein [Halomicrobium]|nr:MULTISPECIES: hypothetical protein [Halomicrobium]QCD66657.1 hypothetical protein E5139_13755 [Halomicrobium mukohataei]QFR21463.1 hypothetical protein GBQ70_13770 [Halomicrobium sp. ZPS1]